MELRSYQTTLVDRTRLAFQRGKRAVLLVAPCGSGKTVLFSFFAGRASAKGKQVLILAHRDELLEQISGTLECFGVRHSFIAASKPYDCRLPVQVGSVLTVARRLDRITPPDIIIIDEAHHAVAGSWLALTERFPRAWRLGVTATPERLSGEPLGEVFDDLIIGPTVKELVSLGALAPYRIFAPSSIDLNGVHVRGGDFARGELAAASDKPSITGDAVREYQRHADGKQAVAFCVSIEHARHVADQFRLFGYNWSCLDGTMDRELRRSLVREFREGKLSGLATCDLISEGFDLPAIEVAVMLRPTQSKALWLQQSGRALRPWPGKSHALILDHAGNCMRHGLPDQEHGWSLDGRYSDKGDGGGGLSVRVCPKCFAAQPSGGTVCTYCGWTFEVMPREIEHREGELSELDLVAAQKERRQEQGQAVSMAQLVALGKSRGYKFPHRWAHHVFQARQARKLNGGQK